MFVTSGPGTGGPDVLLVFPNVRFNRNHMILVADAERLINLWFEINSWAYVRITKTYIYMYIYTY